jgi:cyclopropane-fatty-acyl-phospholipid synthase
MPMKRSGRSVTEARRVMEIEDVLEASIASGFRTGHRRMKILRLASSFSDAASMTMSQSAKFFLEDYRDIPGPFERIVSVGMFEHVGIDHYGSFFGKISDLLSDDGVALLHSIGRPDGPGHTNPWIARHIFPGGYAPALSEVLPAIERAGLLVTDIEILRIHYAETLRIWRERFESRRDEIRRLYDERFCRMWEFYLITSELSFRHQGMMVFQIQLAKRNGTVPITRDYIERFEADHPVPTLGQ